MFTLKNTSLVVASLLLCGVYYLLGYHTAREDFYQLFLLVVLAACVAFYIYKTTGNSKAVLGIGLACRIILLFSVPWLSQDFYRFIWDGDLLMQGFSPYALTPDQIIQQKSIVVQHSSLLYQKMGNLSAAHYSNYPPVNQLFFVGAVFLGGKSFIAKMLMLKLIILSADLGIFVYGKKLLRLLGKSDDLIGLYFLNPLVILELSGNLHFEGVMLFLFTLSLYFFCKNKLVVSSFYGSASIATKLVPLMLLPFFLKQMKLKENCIFFGIMTSIALLLFFLFFGIKTISTYSDTVALWFNNFEFNASIYYIVNKIGYFITGYNTIAIVGKALAFLSLATILLLAFISKKGNLHSMLKNMCLAFFVYLLFSTTVHPWYIITLLLLGIFSGYRFPLLWSITAYLSYAAYISNGVEEKWYVLLLEYLPVLVLSFYEMKENNINSETVKTHPSIL